MSKVVKLGTKVKDYSFKDQNDNEVNLSQFKGKKVLLSFHPLAFTSVCANQMKALEDSYQKFEDSNTVVLGISVDAAPAKKAWGEQLEIEKVLLLADFWPHGGFAKKLGIFRKDDGFSERANIILDEESKVIFAKVYPIGELPNLKEVVDFVDNN